MLTAPVSARAIPVKLTTAPVSARPALKPVRSAPGSNGSVCSRTVMAQPPLIGGMKATSQPGASGASPRTIPLSIAARTPLAGQGHAQRRVLTPKQGLEGGQVGRRRVDRPLAPAGDIGEAAEQQ